MAFNINNLWFLFWVIFINCFGYVDAEFFVVVGFVITFMIVHEFLYNNVDFSVNNSQIVSISVDFRNLGVFLADYFVIFWANIVLVMRTIFHLFAFSCVNNVFVTSLGETHNSNLFICQYNIALNLENFHNNNVWFYVPSGPILNLMRHW